MTRRRAKNPEGQFIGDDPLTPDVNEAWVEETSDLPGDSEESEEKPPEVEPGAEPEIDQSAPAVVEISTPVEAPVKEAQSPEAIGAAMQERLSKRSESSSSNPFVPTLQLENEVKDIAKKEGFPLSRGTEVGARLIARAKRGS